MADNIDILFFICIEIYGYNDTVPDMLLAQKQ